ncbi:MAG: hypothetical protein AAFV98_20560, partial [Chloroflexota bacterium]
MTLEHTEQPHSLNLYTAILHAYNDDVIIVLDSDMRIILAHGHMLMKVLPNYDATIQQKLDDTVEPDFVEQASNFIEQCFKGNCVDWRYYTSKHIFECILHLLEPAPDTQYFLMRLNDKAT